MITPCIIPGINIVAFIVMICINCGIYAENISMFFYNQNFFKIREL